MTEHPHNASQAPDEAATNPTTAMPPSDAAERAQREDESRDVASEMSPSDVAHQEVRDDAGVSPESSEGEVASSAAAAEASESEVAGLESPAAEEEEVEPRGPIEETPVGEDEPKMDWYILKVQSNREDSIRESLQRRVKVAGLDRYFGEIIVPTEMVSEFKGGKKRVVKRKLYPGYLVAHMEINDETWFLVRETPGIGDFTGSAGKPTPMLAHEVSKIVSKQEEKADEAPKLKINFNVGDRVKINEGTFENFEGEVDSIDEASGRVTVMINIFGRSTPVELEYWQIESI